MPQFIIKFVNGAWVSFNRHNFRHIERFKTYAEGVESFKKHGIPVPLPHPANAFYKEQA